MKHYKNEQNETYAFQDDYFDKNGQVINEIVKKIINENLLVEITEEEADAIRNYKSSEQLAEEERLAKLPTSEEILNAKIELKALELLFQLELI